MLMFGEVSNTNDHIHSFCSLGETIAHSAVEATLIHHEKRSQLFVVRYSFEDSRSLFYMCSKPG
jgi:hypothetical protein